MKMEYKRLGDIATYINGYAFKPSDWSDSGLPIIRIQDLTGTSYQTNKYNGKYDSKYEINNGDILISWSASLGIYEWTGTTALLNQHIFKVVFDKAVVDKDFFVHQVSGILKKATSEAHGATMKHLTKPVFDALTFYLPSIEKQKEISTVLNNVSEIISNRKQQLQKLDELVKARFVEMFGDPVENPMGWPTKHLQELVTDDCTISYGIVQTGDDQEYGIPVFRPVDIVNHIPIRAELKKTTEEISNKYKRTILKGREMLITVRANIADTYIVGEEFAGCNVGRGIVPIRTKENEMILEFLKYQIDSKHLNDNIKALAKGITLIQLNMEDLREVMLTVPPIEQQKNFVKFAKQVDKSKFVCLTSVAIYNKLFHNHNFTGVIL